MKMTQSNGIVKRVVIELTSRILLLIKINLHGIKTKNMEVVLAAKVFFQSSGGLQADLSKSERKKDPFLVGSNSYIKLSYKMLDCSISELVIDPKSVSTSPASQFAQIMIKQEIMAENCMIWNSFAEDVRHVNR